MLGHNKGSNNRNKLLPQVQNDFIQFNCQQCVTTRGDLLTRMLAGLGQSVMYELLNTLLFFKCANSSEGFIILGENDGWLPMHANNSVHKMLSPS